MSAYEEEEELSTPDHERKERRWNIPIPVRVQGRRSDGTDFEEESITADASPSGMCLLLPVQVRKGDHVLVTAPEEGFESQATVTHTSALGPNMSRIRVEFPPETKFDRKAAPRKYIYDYDIDNWIGYIEEGIYYNSKHEPFGKVEGSNIVSEDSGQVLFVLRWDRLYDGHGKCLGHVV